MQACGGTELQAEGKRHGACHARNKSAGVAGVALGWKSGTGEARELRGRGGTFTGPRKPM